MKKHKYVISRDKWMPSNTVIPVQEVMGKSAMCMDIEMKVPITVSKLSSTARLFF